MHWVSLFAFLILNKFFFSQHSDCKSALIYDSKQMGEISISEGYGNEMEIFGHPIYNDHFFTEEHNTLWIYLYFRDSAEFEFELTPDLKTADFDFMLYKIDRPNFCDYIKKNQPIPIRSNLARKNPKSGGITGMRATHENAYSKAGYEPYFSSTLKINKGDEFYLIIDSPYGGNGKFKLFSECEFIDTNVVPKSIFPSKKNIEKESQKKLKLFGNMSFVFTNDSSLAIPYKDIKIKGLDENDSIIKHQTDSLKIITKSPSKKYEFTVTANGYEQQTFSYRSFKLKDTLVQFRLTPLKIGSVLQFENIRFVPNKAAILDESRADIEKLISFLTVNDNISIEIGGHVNGLGKNKIKYKSLSKKRAKSVYKELIDSEIAANRLNFIGHGNQKPIYKVPTTLEQSSANRRVEITVVEIK